jgi:beta-lactamase superfamily II metal-dependent hydrolase
MRSSTILLDRCARISHHRGMAKRYTLNVSREVYLLIQDRRLAMLRQTGKSTTVEDVLRKLLRLKDEPSERSGDD